MIHKIIESVTCKSPLIVTPLTLIILVVRKLLKSKIHKFRDLIGFTGPFMSQALSCLGVARAYTKWRIIIDIKRVGHGY